MRSTRRFLYLFQSGARCFHAAGKSGETSSLQPPSLNEFPPSVPRWPPIPPRPATSSVSNTLDFFACPHVTIFEVRGVQWCTHEDGRVLVETGGDAEQGWLRVLE